MEYIKCPNCNKNLKGIFASDLVPPAKKDFINKHLNLNAIAYCTSCSEKLIEKIAQSFQKQKKEIEGRLQKIIHFIPILSSPAPVKWDYDVVGLVTSQTNAGTGFTRELSFSFLDFFGGTSKSTNRLIENATTLCKDNLRVQCVKNGGNAIISTDIDFNEIGSGNTHMLMVCMAGTAIKVLDMNNFDPKRRETMIEVIDLTEKLEAIAAIIK